MQAAWLGNLKNDERKNFEASIRAAKNVLDKLHEIVYNKVKEAESVNLSSYDSPSWSHKQAHTNGYNAALKEVLALLDLDKRGPTP